MPKRITPEVEFTKEWINSIPKTINSNGCWIPANIPTTSHGYVRVAIHRKEFKLHRIVMCVFNQIEYNNMKIVSRHSKDCIRACFNPKHITCGSDSDNIRDSVLYGTHKETRKLVCPKCGSEYRKHKRRRFSKVTWERYCRVCSRH